MKKTNLLIAAAAIVVAAFTSCSKKSDSSSSATPSNSYAMRATVAGTALNIDSCVFIPYQPDPTYVEIFAVGKGANTDPFIDHFPTISIEIHPYNGMGTYTMSPNNTDVEIRTSSSSTLYSGIGTVTVTQTDPYVAGTFSFTATNATQVTNGSFVAQYK